MKKNAQEIADANLQDVILRPEGSFGTVIHYVLSLHNEDADIGEEVSLLMYAKLSNFYPSCRVELKTWLAPNHEFNIKLSVWQS